MTQDERIVSSINISGETEKVVQNGYFSLFMDLLTVIEVLHITSLILKINRLPLMWKYCCDGLLLCTTTLKQ